MQQGHLILIAVVIVAVAYVLFSGQGREPVTGLEQSKAPQDTQQLDSEGAQADQQGDAETCEVLREARDTALQASRNAGREIQDVTTGGSAEVALRTLDGMESPTAVELRSLIEGAPLSQDRKTELRGMLDDAQQEPVEIARVAERLRAALER